MSAFTTEQLAALSPHDRAEIMEFENFLREAGPHGGVDRKERLWRWIAKDPEANGAYLGLTESQIREGLAKFADAAA